MKPQVKDFYDRPKCWTFRSGPRVLHVQVRSADIVPTCEAVVDGIEDIYNPKTTIKGIPSKTSLYQD